MRGAGEVVVVDGGSTDGTADLAEPLGARVIRRAARPGQPTCGRGGGRSAATGCCCCTPILGPAAGWQAAVAAHMAARRKRGATSASPSIATHPRARRLERLVAWRCRVLALPYGDQGLLIHRDLLRAVGGIRPLPLMEDVDLVRRLGRRRLVGAAMPPRSPRRRTGGGEGWQRRSAAQPAVPVAVVRSACRRG